MPIKVQKCISTQHQHVIVTDVIIKKMLAQTILLLAALEEVFVV